MDAIERVEELLSMKWLGYCSRLLEVPKEISRRFESLELYDD